LYFGAGETPTPQENLVIVEQAGKPVLKRRLYFGAGETPTPQENLVIVEQAGKPVPKNGERCVIN
jgi:hypothetical protein